MRIRCLGALVALAVLCAGCASAEDSAETTSGDVASSRSAPSSAVSATEGEVTTTEATPSTTAEPDGSAGDPLPLGTEARVGDYSVTITAVRLDATTEVERANPFNADPGNGQYALASVTVVYDGDEEGTPIFDVSIVLQGGDARQYETYHCPAVLPRPSYEVSVLTAGGAAEYDVCFDIPSAAAIGATIFAEDQLTFDDPTRIHWAAA